MNIIVSLDYELFLNDITGTVSMCLVKPMEELQKICHNYGIKLTVFVDAAYLQRMSELKKKYKKVNDDYEQTVNNIRWLVEKGHDVQLHLHPQWYYSDHNGEEWQLDWAHYKLSDMPDEDAFAKFQESKALLDSIVGYKTTLYRAGGYSIQDFPYQKCFKINGIIGDSSVLPGSKVIHKTHSYDYRKAPQSIYRFTEDITTPKENGDYVEFPISSTSPVFILRYRKKKKIFMAVTDKNWGDGGDLPAKSLFRKLKVLISSCELFKHPHGTIDYQSYFWLNEAYQHSKQFGCMVIIGHPKNFSSSSLSYFDRFIRECQKNGDTFITMHQYFNLSTK